MEINKFEKSIKYFNKIIEIDENYQRVMGKLIHCERYICDWKNYDYKILTLVMDLSNPSPSQGWLELERMSFKNRFKTDSLIALALIHHLAITKNIPINQILFL